MTNSEYWRKRMEAQAGSVYKRCDQFIAELMRQYQTAVRAMEADIAKWYQRFADANGITLAEAGKLLNSDELLEFQWTVEDYIRSGQQNAVSGIWMKELESASARVHISRLDSLKMSLRQHVEELIGMQLTMLPEVLHATYRESYDRTVYELSRGSRVMFSYQKPDVRRIDRVLGTPWSSDGKEFSERVWDNRAQLIGSMNTHLTQSIIRGEDPQKAINAIAKDMGVSKRRAGTLVMTESAAIATAAQRDCYKDLDVEEFEYVCTLDEVTCPVCGAMDGKHFPMSKYEIGVTVPPMHPNCRCATAPYFDDMDDWGAERAARDENGKTVSVPAEMTYEQWKAQQKKADNAPVDKQLTGKSVPEKYRKRENVVSTQDGAEHADGEAALRSPQFPKNYKDERNVGDPIDSTSLEKIAEKAANSRINLGTAANGFNGFVEYRGDPEVLDSVLDHLKEQQRVLTINGFSDKIVLGYDVLTADNGETDIATFALTKGSTITLNKFLYDDSKFLEREYAEMVAKGWFAKGTTYLNVPDHEVGHVFAYNVRRHQHRNDVNRTLRYAIADYVDDEDVYPYIKDHISHYAMADQELISELFSMRAGSQPELAEVLLRKARIKL